jgi:XapX domain-containing protein
MGKLIVGCVLALGIGAACRWFDIPLPSPPKMQGALIVVAMTFGYFVTDIAITRAKPDKGPASSQALCGGPTGLPQSKMPGQSASTQTDH